MMSKRVYAMSPSEQEAARDRRSLERTQPLTPEQVAMIHAWLRT